MKDFRETFIDQEQLKLLFSKEKFQHFLKTVLSAEKYIMTSRLVPFSKTAKRLQDYEINFQNFILLILFHFLKGENSLHGFTTGQMKIIESQRHSGACNSSITLVALGT